MRDYTPRNGFLGQFSHRALEALGTLVIKRAYRERLTHAPMPSL
eukprot:CAMPEP_0117505424 /NCGR_PEP_ID=MMETSP0784-20121206/25371_1 /TAXON_ID=39447 /ORGANISM="" /LENGTH=43 /DNA_ID= /DNA_START= /DNA_END= /DNA_ORIENTATION=